MIKRAVYSEFKMKDIGSAKKILAMGVERDKNKDMLKIHQRSYVE